ncbi:MAG TPA: TIGR03000 domain-containing protein, partial [Gemmataceae bacterium]|nr:TIGR03000 domain-containing protein [Gemmataceae bacterium]
MIRSSLTATVLSLSVFSTGLISSRAAEGSPADRAVLIVHLPADARLTIESEPTAQRGSERVFESPRLPAGKSFVYTLVATWNEADSAREATRTATVQAGKVTRVDFQKAGPAAQANAAKARTFLFTYGGTITGLTPKQTARIWLPVPPRDEDQDVEMVSQQLPA